MVYRLFRKEEEMADTELSEDEVIRKTDEIFERRYKHLRQTNPGGVVIIDALTEEAVVGQDQLETGKRYFEKFGRNRPNVMYVLPTIPWHP